MNEELKGALETLSTELEGKSKAEAKAQIEAFEVKYKETVANEVKAVKDEFEAKLKEVQDHADKLDIKLQSKEVKEAQKGDQIKSVIKENFEQIKDVKKGQSVEIKAVADMTTANQTGDEARQYNFDVVKFPNQKVNVADLTGTVNIFGGTYTFIREGAGEGSISAQTEGSAKSQRDYDFTTVDITTDFIAGFARYSKKMRNNLPYLESFLPNALRRDYWKQENSAFYTVIAAAATASSQVITSKNKAEMLMNEVATLDASDYEPNAIVVTSADYHSILQIEKSTGAGYGLPFGFTYDGGQLRCLGIPVLKANWMAANKYFVGDWSRVNKVVTEGLSLEFSESDSDNFTKNNITARIEAQVAVAVEQPAALILGDFTAT
jgi:HK97 family phage major capsid protein